jgi:Flp pilus assembly protein TadD
MTATGTTRNAAEVVRLKAVRDLIAAGEPALAAERCEAIVRAVPNDPTVRILAADLALRTNRRADAAAHLQTAAASATDDPVILVQCAVLLLQAGARRESLAIATRAETLAIPDAEVNDALGALLTHHEEAARALPLATRAVQLAPDNTPFRYNLAMVQRMTGDFEAAEENLDRVIAARPFDSEAHLARSGLRKQTPDRNHVDELERVVKEAKGRRAWIPAGFALAKELEDLGEYERSFAHLAAACRAHRATLRYDVAGDVAVLDALRTTHDRAALERVQVDFDNNESIFIVGLPRSGTTLVDRMLGSHPAVFSAGELKAFPESVIAAVTRGGSVSKLDFVQSALKISFKELGPAYLEAARPRTAHTAKFTDKLSPNYLYAGLIHAALPRARFVAVRRHPMDSCYAMYKALFIGAYPFSYDLGDLGRYYVAWDRLMRHWEEVLGDAWLNVQYEDLIANPARVCRRIVEHCGLEWHEECLNFHALQTPVSTASAVQVRQPIYKESVGRWRHYARQLSPLAEHLEAHGLSAT